MFYVGVYAYYPGADKAGLSKVLLIDKLGRSAGRGERFIKNHPPKTIDGLTYRAMVFVLPHQFILRNDVVQASLRAYRCEWLEAKFHVYRLGAVQIMAKQSDWSDLLPAEPTVADTSEPTETAPSETAVQSV